MQKGIKVLSSNASGELTPLSSHKSHRARAVILLNMSFEKPQRYQPLQGWEPNVATEFALEVRLDRLEKRLFKWIRFMAIALLISLLIAVWALTYSFMVST